jgi:putative membrane protein
VEPAGPDTHFSWLRTRLSIERTLMSWVRTASALVGFGFSLVAFFEQLRQMRDAAPARFPHATRLAGAVMIAAGIVGLSIAIWQYRTATRELRAAYPDLAAKNRVGPTLMIVSCVLVAIGVLALLAVVLRAI